MNAVGPKRKKIGSQIKHLSDDEMADSGVERFSHLIRDFSDGKIERLQQTEFKENLTAHLIRLNGYGDSQAVLELIEAIAVAICGPDPRLREQALSTLVGFSGGLVGGNNYRVIIALFNTLARWFASENELIQGYGLGCSQLHKLAQRMFERREYWQTTASFLIVLQKIQDGRLVKDQAILDMAVKLQDSLATKAVLEKLLSCYLNDKSDLRDTIGTLLSNLGRRATVHMVNVLMHSQKKEERLQLINLIPKAGTGILPVLQECLQQGPPWYVVRNIIFIVSELDDPAAFALVRPFLAHTDIRVQQQVVRCIVRSSNGFLADRMTDALFEVNDQLKMPIIMHLAHIGGDRVAASLVELLSLRKSFEQESYIELLVRLCRAFLVCSVKEVVPALHALIKERQSHAGPSDPVISAARDTILSLKSSFPVEVDAVISETDLTDDGFGFKHTSTAIRSARRSERSVKEMVEQGDLENAGKKLFSYAIKAARDNDFASAELLRNKILEISPLALSEVIRLGQIIEEEKSSSISSQHIAVWSELYEKLTTEEFYALYFALKHERYTKEEVIVRAGDTDPSLYFVNSGVVTLSCQSEKSETVLKRLEQGEVIGVSPFFDYSVWTVSMTAESGSLVHVLSAARFMELKENFPSINDKLHDYCLKYDTVPHLLQMAGSDRRDSPRYAVSVNINNMLLDPYGNVGKRMFKGELIDISRGGLRFTVSIASRENARLLLGRQIISIIEIKGQEKLKCFGVIVGGRFQEEGGQEFVVHVNFHQHLEQSSLAQVTNLEMQGL